MSEKGPEDRGRDAHCWTPTGSPGAVTRLRFPQNVACGSPALRSSEVDLQHCESLQLAIREVQFRSQQRGPFFDLAKDLPGQVTAGPATAAQHLTPIPLDGPIHLLQRTDISGDAY